jgi:hypothetical protein
LQQQEQLMQQLMQDEAQRQTQDVSSVELEEELLEQEALEKELLEKERLAEEALENELGSDDTEFSADTVAELGSSTKKNSLFDD